ncbi:hypothetical protein [Enemella sp. A6]|uniref:hypothetical protein n=1 Tax=Enemella sp. A6 TaxID=3440152 RepID=UPI003EB9A7D3
MITVTMKLEQEHPYPSAEQAVVSETEIEVSDAPTEYFLTASSRAIFSSPKLPACAVEGPAGPVELVQEKYWYRFRADQNGLHQLTCRPSETGSSFVDVFRDSDALLAYHQNWSRMERLLITGAVLLALAFPVFLVGLIMNWMSIARRREIFGGGLPTAGTTLFTISTAVAAPIAAGVLAFVTVTGLGADGEFSPFSYGLGVAVGAIGFLLALVGLVRMADDTKKQNHYARNAGLLNPVGPMPQQAPYQGHYPPPPSGQGYSDWTRR